MKKLVTLLLLFAAAVSSAIVYASDITGATYLTRVIATNTASTANTNIAQVLSLSTPDMVSSGMLGAAATDAAIILSGGDDVYFMPGANDTAPWITMVPSISGSSQVDLYLYTKTATGGEYRWFPGAMGGDVADAAGLEHGANFTDAMDAYISSDGYLFRKGDEYNVTYDTASDNVTALIRYSENVSGYTEVDSGAFLAPSGATITGTAVPSTADNYDYKDFGAGHFQTVDSRFQIYTQGDAVNPVGVGGVAFTNTVNDITGLAATDIWLRSSPQTGAVVWFTLGRGNAAVTDTFVGTANVSYYPRFYKPYGTDTVTAYIYSDPERETLADTLTITGAGANTTYRYAFGFINNNSGVGNRFWTGYVRNFTFQSFSVAATGITAGSQTVSVSANTTSFGLYINDVLQSTTALLGAVPDTPAVWQVGSGATAYITGANMTVGGTMKGDWNWQYAATFTDLTGNSNALTPTFRTTSMDPAVTMSIASQTSVVTSTSPTANSTGTVLIGDVPGTPPGMYSEGGSDYPGGPEVEQLATDTGVPYLWWMMWIAIGVSVGGGVLVYGATHNQSIGRNGSLFIFWLVSTVIYVVFVIAGDGVVPAWPLVIHGLWCFCLMLWFNPFRTAIG